MFLLAVPVIDCYLVIIAACRCHGLRVYPVCVCNTVRLGQDTTLNRRVHGLSVYPV